MTRAAKITYIVALLFGISIGAYFGFQRAMFRLGAYYSVMQLEAPSALDHFSYLQYRYADSEHAKAGLQMSASLLEEIEKLNPERSQERDLAVTYTRLALLEDAADHSQQSHALMTKARYWYAASGGRDYSESEMKDMLKTRDEVLQQ
jgi:hypothetical protein